MGNTLRELQLCEFGILKDIRDVCNKHGIHYYLSSGTLLGAVRHQGFIPWDDDVDIEMPYRDYLRFLEIAPEELGSYYIQNSNTDPHFYFAYTKVRKNNTAMLPDWEANTHSHHGVWVDVFPMAYIGGSVDFRFKQLLLRIRTFLRMHDDEFSNNRKWLIQCSNAPTVMFIKMVRHLPQGFRYKICKTIEKHLFQGKEKANLANVWSSITRRIPTESFEPASELLFEGERFSVPKDYDTYLRIAYGDYMSPPPEGKRSGGHGDLHVDLEHSWKPGDPLPPLLETETT